MELIQTIWTALTIENEGLIQAIGVPLTFLEAYVHMLLFTTVLNIPRTRKQSFIYVISFSTLGILLNIIIPKIYTSFILMIIYPILILLIFKVTILKAVVAEFIPLLISIVIEMLISKLYIFLLGVQYEEALNIPIYRISIVLLIYFVMYCFYRICNRFSINVAVMDNMDKKNKYLLIATIFLAIISIGMQIVIITFFNNVLPLSITVISIITLIAYFFTSLYSINKATKLQITTQSLEESQLYNKSLKILHDNVRAFKHDFSNIVQAIGGYIGTEDMDGLQTYYSQLLDDCQKVNNLYTLSPEVINNPAIYSILASKYHKADELGITIHMEIFLNLNELNMKIYEFTRILGILMDNAIEASKECENKMIRVEIRKDFNINRQILLIENTYEDKEVNIDRIFEKGYSSKSNNTGLGLWEVREVLKKNHNLNLFTTKNDTMFSQQLEIYSN